MDLTKGEQIATAIRAALTGPRWHGPVLSDLIGDVSASEAAATPIRSAHSIWEIVLHLAAGQRCPPRASPGSPASA